MEGVARAVRPEDASLDVEGAGPGFDALLVGVVGGIILPIVGVKAV